MQLTSIEEHALGGAAVRKQITITIGSTALHRQLHLLLYLPAVHAGPVPIFIGLNFNGNATVTTDAGVDLNEVWIPDTEESSVPLAQELKGHIRRKLSEKLAWLGRGPMADCGNRWSRLWRGHSLRRGH